MTPAQRLVVGLVAVHAALAAPIRELTLDDVDLAGRRITRRAVNEVARFIVRADDPRAALAVGRQAVEALIDRLSA